MKRLIVACIFFLFTGFLNSTVPSLAEEDFAVSGSATVTARVVDGEDESAKFEEYREIPDGLSGDLALRIEKKEQCVIEFSGKDIAEDDQEFTLSGNRYGSVKASITYDELPHRFAYDALTLYSGIGSERLSLDDTLQEKLQGLSSLRDITAQLEDSFSSGASRHDLELKRKTGAFSLDVAAFDPFSLHVEASTESREGERPFFGSFGLFNTLEIAEPIDYETTEFRATFEYAKMPYFASVSYYVSLFENDSDNVVWDNPFRATDRTHEAASFAPFSLNSGASSGLIDLYPDNTYHNLSVTGSIMDLPLKTTLTATTSLGWWDQDDDLKPYTTNTAIIPGAANNPPFSASSPANLPSSEADGRVESSLYNLKLTSRPRDFMHLSAKYRYYQYENDTDVLEFPGLVVTDASWKDATVQTRNSGYIKHTADINAGFDVAKWTTLTLGYRFDETKRDKREVSRQTDDVYSAAVDSRPCSWLDLRISYEKSIRDIDDYDYTVPFECTAFTPQGECITPQLPFLLKYDEADRDRDRLRFLANVYPADPLTVTASFLYGRDDFDDSSFGLLEDKHRVYSLDVDYSLSERLDVYAFYSYEEYRNTQRARQWGPAGFSDPYLVETGVDSASNWKSEQKDDGRTFGSGFSFALLPKRLDLHLTYSYSDSDGEVSLSSPVGALDLNPFVPLDFTEVDDISIQTLNARVDYTLNGSTLIVVGYAWEKYEVDDFNNNDFANIPETVSGSYNGAMLMGTLPEDYDVNIIYTRLKYSF